ncbi:MAG: transcription termination/antitermination protein NusA [Clostridia bacterium]|nr:transcription termination/antitermination protein NusA [Clostridia bacterium]MBR6619040.1 transcription termination/antitermination protein NusA [Clostridia bacterium]
MDTKEFFAAVKMLEKEKNIPADILCERIQAAIVSAIKGEYGRDIGYCDIDLDAGEMAVYLRKNVVSEISDPITDLLPEEAQRYKKGAVPGDIVEIQLETKDFSRIAASTTKNVIRQGIREAERSQIKQEFQSKHQELVTVRVVNIDAETGNATVELGKGESVLPKTEQVPGEVLKVGDLVKVYVVDIRDGEKSGVKAMISRTHPGLVRRLFEEEVPEIFDGTVEIKAISREAGSRTKVAVYCADADVDAVGSCIGARGARVGKVVDLLGGEKIDIVKYSEDPAEFIAASLAPADVISVEVLEDAPNSCCVTVPDNQLSLAIGNKGQNARLAARLTGWKIDIKPESGFFEIQE